VAINPAIIKDCNFTARIAFSFLAVSNSTLNAISSKAFFFFWFNGSFFSGEDRGIQKGSQTQDSFNGWKLTSQLNNFLFICASIVYASSF
jgi:hypothetical protein